MSWKSLAVPDAKPEEEIPTDELCNALIEFKESSKSVKKKEKKKLLMSPKSVTQRVELET